MKFLCAFDFDDTLITQNSDYYILKLLPQGVQLPQEVIDLYSDSGWIDYMNGVFKFLKKNGVSSQIILDFVVKIPMMPGFENLMKWIKSEGGDIIIISDANTIFIENYLEKNQLKHLVNKIFSNKASISSEGEFKIEGFHQQNECELSTLNLCKGKILEEFVKNEGLSRYEMVIYIGDGGNDFCPSLRLGEKDLVFFREGFSLEKKLKKEGEKMKGRSFGWKSGEDIMKVLPNILSKTE